jgi:hypothetical protein
MHSHPYFNHTTNAELNRGKTCHGGGPYNLSAQDIQDLNSDNHDFGIGTSQDPGDELWWNSTSTPLYLLVPTGGTIKKQDHIGGPWVVYP